jgi:hypothetical protein
MKPKFVTTQHGLGEEFSSPEGYTQFPYHVSVANNENTVIIIAIWVIDLELSVRHSRDKTERHDMTALLDDIRTRPTDPPPKEE